MFLNNSNRLTPKSKINKHESIAQNLKEKIDWEFLNMNNAAKQ